MFIYRKKMNRIGMGKRRGGEGREEKGEVGKRRERRGQKRREEKEWEKT